MRILATGDVWIWLRLPQAEASIPPACEHGDNHRLVERSDK